MRTSTFALLLALGQLACQSGESGDPPLHPVPETPASAAPAQHTHETTGATQTTGRAAPLPPGGNNQLPPDHPPIPPRNDSALPPDHPPLPNDPAAMGGQAAPFGGPSGPSNLRWTAPASWVEEPPSNNMRLTQWRVGSGPDGPVECYMARFAGSGGSVDDNLNRWINQFTQPDGAASAERAARDSQTINGMRVTTLALTGTFQTRNPPMSGPIVDMPGFAMYGAIIETPEGPYFLKCTGPESTLAAERAGVEALVQSFTAP